MATPEEKAEQFDSMQILVGAIPNTAGQFAWFIKDLRTDPPRTIAISPPFQEEMDCEENMNEFMRRLQEEGIRVVR